VTEAREHAGVTPGLIGAMLVVVAACARASAGFTMLPGWESSPMDFVAPESSWTPTISLGLDVVTLLGAALCVGGALRVWWSVAVLMGGLAVAARMLLGGSIDDLVIGSNWIAGVAGMVALMSACADRTVRGIAMGTLAGFMAVLVFKGVLQVLVEQPATMEMFKQSKEAFFASRGWGPDSPMARGFERRLMQPEATGWFGLSNVFATFVAAGFAIGLGVTVHAWRAGGKAKLAGLGVLFASVVGLVQCGSKGGIAVAVLGAMVVIGAIALQGWGVGERLSQRGLQRVANGAGVMAIAGVLGGIAVRGLIGERLHELSLLFRWFYLQGATRIFGEHAWLGVGPAGFQEAYMLAKPALSPEDVNSPHSVLWDWAATLGIGGVAWGVMLVFVAMRLGRVLVGAHASAEGRGAMSSEPSPNPIPLGGGVKAVFLVAAGATLFGAWCERGVVTPEGALLRIGGLVVWVALAAGLVDWFATSARAAGVAAAGAMVCLAHMQMDVTAVQATSGPLVLAILGVAAAPVIGARVPRGAWIGRLVAAAAMVLPIAGLVRVVPWENALREAAAVAQGVGAMRMKASELRQSSTREGLEQFARELERATGRAVIARPEAIDAALGELETRAGLEALTGLKSAADREPAHVGTVSALGQLQFRLAETLTRAGRGAEANAMISDARNRAAWVTIYKPRSVNAWQWRATAEVSTAQLKRDGRNWPEMMEAYEHCIEFAPHSLAARVGLVETLLQRKIDAHAGERGASEHADVIAEAAREVLRVDEQLRLDPLIRLTDAQRRRMEGLVRR
jgi:hypothetical protein